MGEIGRFRSANELERGSRALVRTSRGLEVGAVLRPVSTRLAEMMHDQPTGDVVRPMDDADDQAALQRESTAVALLARAEQLGAALLDAEVLFDGSRAVLYHVGLDNEMLRDAIRQMSREFGLTISAEGLGLPRVTGGCGSGGCGSCGTVTHDDVRSYFAGLREQMEAHRRVPLL
jgi:hypothetical protein